MTSKIDDICTNILLVLSKNTADAIDYAKLQRDVGAGSSKTIKKHVSHLSRMGLVEVRTEKRGMRCYYKISLSSKGVDTVQHFQQKGN
jgi:DNA-binding HxlR family transcriptional regulator